jgi:hypothetical protein
MKRTLAVAVTALLTGTSLWLASAPAYARARPPAPASATIKILQKWTYQGDGRLAVTAACSRRQDARIIMSTMLPGPVNLRDSGKLLIHVTGRTKPGRYTITLWCTPANGRVDALDMASVRIVKHFPPFRQPPTPRLPKHFKANVTVSSGPPVVKHGKKKAGHSGR